MGLILLSLSQALSARRRCLKFEIPLGSVNGCSDKVSDKEDALVTQNVQTPKPGRTPAATLNRYRRLAESWRSAAESALKRHGKCRRCHCRLRQNSLNYTA